MIKLGRALFYRHTGQLFDGDLYVRHIDNLRRDVTPKSVEAVVRFAPDFIRPERGKKPLTDQFIYRFNASAEYGVLYAVVQFSEQMIFQITAISQKMANTLADMRAVSGKEMPKAGLVRTPLKHRLNDT